MPSPAAVPGKEAFKVEPLFLADPAHARLAHARPGAEGAGIAHGEGGEAGKACHEAGTALQRGLAKEADKRPGFPRPAEAFEQGAIAGKAGPRQPRCLQRGVPAVHDKDELALPVPADLLQRAGQGGVREAEAGCRLAFQPDYEGLPAPAFGKQGLHVQKDGLKACGRAPATGRPFGFEPGKETASMSFHDYASIKFGACAAVPHDLEQKYALYPIWFLNYK